jgi:hypothetical protein
MRRLLALAGAVCVAAAVISVPSVASADVSYLYARATIDRLDPDHLVKITVAERSSAGGLKISATLHHLDPHADPYGTVGGFRLISGTEENGTWEATYKPDVEAHPGRTFVAVTAQSGTGPAETMMTSGFMACYTASFTELSTTPSTVDIDHREVTLEGRALYQVSRETSPQPVVARTVRQYPSEGSGTVTDAEGRFRIQATASPSVTIEVLRGDSPICGYTQQTTVGVNKKATEMSASLIAPPQPIAVGTGVAVEGKILRHSDNGLVPADNMYVSAYLDRGSDTEVRLGGDMVQKDGTFRLTVSPPGAGKLSVRTSGNVFLDGSEVDLGFLDVRPPSSFTYFDASPEPVAQDDLVYGHGSLKATDKGKTIGLGEVRTQLQFSADGKTGWTSVGMGTTDRSGYLYVHAPARRDGYWRLSYDGDTTHMPSVSVPDYVDVKYRTSISSFNASPEPVKKGRTITVSGKLNRYVGAWGALGGKTVYIYFRSYGSPYRYYKGVATSDRYGKWSKGFKAVQDGTWTARYKGDGTYLPADSASDYVDVR